MTILWTIQQWQYFSSFFCQFCEVDGHFNLIFPPVWQNNKPTKVIQLTLQLAYAFLKRCCCSKYLFFHIFSHISQNCRKVKIGHTQRGRTVGRCCLSFQVCILYSRISNKNYPLQALTETPHSKQFSKCCPSLSSKLFLKNP